MKKRVLSIVCVIALIATMISAGAIFAIGTDTVALEDEAFAFAGTSFVDTDWTATNSTPTFGEDGVKLNSVNDTTYATIKYKDSYNLTNGFTLEYVAKAKAQSSTIDAGTYFTGVQIGNVTVAMDQFIKPVILVDGTVKATGTAIYTGDDIRNGWVNGEEPEIDEIKYTVTYDVNNKTLTYARYHGTTQVFSLVYTDTTRQIDVEAADVVLYHNNNKRSYATYKSIKLTGASADSVIPPSVLYGTGVQFGDSIAPVASDWTLSGSSKINTDSNSITLNNGNTDVYINGTYNNTFILTDGFTLTYTANGRYYNNYANGKTYLGVTVGNITAGLELVDGAAVVLKIKVDGATVATSDPIFDANHSSWSASKSKAENMNYFFGSYAKELSLNYDPATKTLTYAEGNIAATYVDDADAIDVNDVTVGLKHHASWNGYGVYKTFKLVGATCTEHVYDDDNDTTCNNCGATRTIGGEGEGEGEGEDEPAIERGDALTETWTPEMIEDEWTGSVSNLVDGAFVIKKDGESVTKTIWSVKEFDLSAGFKFTGSLTMKNGYNNFYGEWCSAYFGTEAEYLELRIKNDSPNNTAKVKTYTAYILYNGEILASSSMAELVNGTYELTYKDGKVSVKFKDVAIDWTLADETVATEVAVDANLAKAKVGLRLVNNWDPSGRKWAKISVAPIATASEGEGEDDGVVRGETLTKWEPEEFLEEDWMDSDGMFDDGKFLIVSGAGTKTVWTAKNYDLSGGFKFKGKLAMKNGYNNYNGEWCSAYFGNEDVNLELRVRNDDTTPSDSDKDNTYTAYIIYKGKTLASCDLVTIPNGEYELSYKDGKVSVNLGGSALKWTLEGTETTATSVDVADADFVNAKLGLRLTGNWCPNGRQWSEISLVSLASGSGAVSTGDARNIVFPAAVMLVCAVAVAFVSLRKKVRA